MIFVIPFAISVKGIEISCSGLNKNCQHTDLKYYLAEIVKALVMKVTVGLQWIISSPTLIILFKSKTMIILEMRKD